MRELSRPQLSRPRHFSLATLLLLVTILVANCGGGNASLEEAEQPAELLWVTLDMSSQVEESLAATYREQHPNITFNRQNLNFNQDYLAVTPAPELLMSFANRAYFLAGRANQFLDLSEVWIDAALNEKLLPNVQTLVKDRESGKPHMLPIAFSWVGVYYNKAIFEQYNLQTPQTWDEFIELCAQLQANGETPLAMAGSESYAYTLWFDYLNLRLNGAAYHRALLAGEERFDDPRLSTVLELWRSLFQNGFVVEHPEFMNASAAINALIRSDNGLLGGEKAAMVLMDTLTINGSPPEFRDELNFFRFPIIDPNIPLAESIDVIGYVIPVNASHSPQAQTFLTYLGSPAAHELIAREAAVINAVYAPVRADLDATALTAEMGKAITMLQESAEVVPFTYQSMPMALWTEFSRAYRALLSDKQDIQSFMNSLETARQTALEQGTLE